MYGRYAPYFFVAPGLLLLVVFFAYPLLDTLYLSLHRYNIFSPPTFVGLDNFRRAWGDELFWRVLANTLLYAIIVVPALVVLSFFMALLLDNSLRLIKVFRTLYYIPVVTSIVVAGIVWKWLYNADGLLNAFPQRTGRQRPVVAGRCARRPRGVLGPAGCRDPIRVVDRAGDCPVCRGHGHRVEGRAVLHDHLSGRLAGHPSPTQRSRPRRWRWLVAGRAPRHHPNDPTLHARGFHHRHYRRLAHLRRGVQ